MEITLVRANIQDADCRKFKFCKSFVFSEKEEML